MRVESTSILQSESLYLSLNKEINIFSQKKKKLYTHTIHTHLYNIVFLANVIVCLWVALFPYY